MKSLLVDHKGAISEVDVTRGELIKAFDVHLRDLRPVISMKQVITFFRRGKGIVLNFRAVKILIGKNKVYVFNTENQNIAEKFVPQLSQKITAREKQAPFEFAVLEQAFAYMADKIQEKVLKIEESSQRIFRKLNVELKNETFEQLLTLKKKLSQLRTNAKEMEEAIEEILEEDEALESLCLSGRKKALAEEVESILENALEQTENIAHNIRELEDGIDDTQEILTLKIATLRNTIIKFDLIISVLTGLFTFLAVIVGLYGMNIKNNLETSHEAFKGVVVALFLSFVVLWGCIYWYLKRKKVL